MPVTVNLSVTFTATGGNDLVPDTDKAAETLINWLTQISGTDYVEDLWDCLGTSAYSMEVSAVPSQPDNYDDTAILRNQAMMMGALILLMQGSLNPDNLVVSLQLAALKKRSEDTHKILRERGAYDG